MALFAYFILGLAVAPFALPVLVVRVVSTKAYVAVFAKPVKVVLTAILDACWGIRNAFTSKETLAKKVALNFASVSPTAQPSAQ